MSDEQYLMPYEQQHKYQTPVQSNKVFVLKLSVNVNSSLHTLLFVYLCSQLFEKTEFHN